MPAQGEADEADRKRDGEENQEGERLKKAAPAVADHHGSCPSNG